MRHVSRENLITVLALSIIFSLILGVSTFWFAPTGLTYSKASFINFAWLVFGLGLARFFARDTLESIHLSKIGSLLIICVSITAVILAFFAGDPMTRAIKLLEILFQDLVIAGVLVSLFPVLEKTKERLVLAFSFAAIHLPLIAVAPLAHAGVVVIASYIVAYLTPHWFVQSKRDMAFIIVPHIVFYLLFGSYLVGITW